MTRRQNLDLDAEWRELIDAAAGMEAEDLPILDRFVCWLLADLRRPVALGLVFVVIGIWIGGRR